MSTTVVFSHPLTEWRKSKRSPSLSPMSTSLPTAFTSEASAVAGVLDEPAVVCVPTGAKSADVLEMVTSRPCEGIWISSDPESFMITVPRTQERTLFDSNTQSTSDPKFSSLRHSSCVELPPPAAPPPPPSELALAIAAASSGEKPCCLKNKLCGFMASFSSCSAAALSSSDPLPSRPVRTLVASWAASTSSDATLCTSSSATGAGSSLVVR